MMTYKDKELIKEYIKKSLGETVSVKNLSEYLVKNGAHEEKYMSGKLKIFGRVAAYLNGLEYEKKEVSHDCSEVEFVFAEGWEFESDVIKKQSEEVPVENKQEDSQMTLF